MKYKTAYRWYFWFKKLLRLPFLPYISLATELASFCYNVTIFLYSTSLKIYGWSPLNAPNGTLKKNERSWLFFALWSQVPFIGLPFVVLHAPLQIQQWSRIWVHFLQHPDLLARPNVKQEMGDVSSLKRSSLPFIERELSLLQGRRAKVPFQTTWEDSTDLAGHSHRQ